MPTLNFAGSHELGPELAVGLGLGLGLTVGLWTGTGLAARLTNEEN